MPEEKKTILIVEDNEMNMELLVELLKMLPYRTLTAASAETGLPLAEEYQPDLILMDLQLPGMDGISATDCLKANEKLNRIPVIAMTGYGFSGFRGSLDQNGFSGMISKPFEIRSLLKTINSFLEDISAPAPLGR